MINNENDIQICKNTFFIHGHCELINPRKNNFCYSSKQCTSKEGFFDCKNNRCEKKNIGKICKQNNNCLSDKCVLSKCL